MVIGLKRIYVKCSDNAMALSTELVKMIAWLKGVMSSNFSRRTIF